jgi:uncharacterized membrane protein
MDWLLVFSLFFHILATIVWLGGLFLLSVWWLPAVQKNADQGGLLAWLEQGRARFYPMANLALLVLMITGVYQMVRSPFYEGVFQFANDWSRAILVKHLATVAMLGVGGLMQWGVLPALERGALRQKLGKPAPELAQLRRREQLLVRINSGLGLVVLFCTAVATAL